MYSKQGWARDVIARDRDVGFTSRDETVTRLVPGPGTSRQDFSGWLGMLAAGLAV